MQYFTLLTSACFLTLCTSMGFAQGNALDFENSGHPSNTEYVNVPYDASLAITGDLTIEAWVKLESLTGDRPWGIATRYFSYDPPGSADYTTQRCYGLVYSPNRSGGPAFLIRMTNDGDFTNGVITAATTTTLQTGVWYHVAGTYEQTGGGNAEVKIYLNGVEEGNDINNQVPSIHSGSSAQVPLHVGVEFNPLDNSNNRYFDGTIDEVRVWSATLSQTTIRDWMCQEITTDHPNYSASTSDDLELYFDFATGSGTTVTDLSANGNDGSFVTTGTGTNTWVTSTAPVPFFTANTGSFNSASTWHADQFVPDIDGARVRIDHDVNVTANETLRSAEISGGNTLTVDSTVVLEIEEGIENNGTLTVENHGSLLQTSTTDLNSGTGSYQIIRRTPQMLDNTRFNLWSSPLSDEAIEDVFPNSNTGDFYSVVGLGYSAHSGTMTPGLGYTATGDVSVTYPTGFDRTFAGNNLNNGEITTNYSDTGHILIGNPYPSGLDLDAFYTANSANLDANFYFWNHTTATTGGSNSGDDWAQYNASTSTGTAATSGGSAPSGDAGAGQGFFAFANAGSSVEFDNTQRVGANDEFYSPVVLEKDAFWLNVSDANQGFSQLAVTFTGISQMGHEKTDGVKFKGSGLSAYTMANNREYGIQGLPKPAGINGHTIPLGIDVTSTGTHTIALHKLESWPSDYKLELIDLATNKRINLLMEPHYTFDVNETGTLKGRFFINVKVDIEENTNAIGLAQDDVALANDNDRQEVTGLDEQNEVSVKVYQTNDLLWMDASEQSATITRVDLITIEGKVLQSETVSNSVHTISTGELPSGVYLLKMEFSNGNSTLEKVALQ